MKKHNLTKFIALAMACTLLVTPMTALGAEGDSEPTSVSVSGNGAVEDIVNKKVYKVVLPTETENASTFDFILDPQDLIQKTDHAAYDDITSVSGNQLYFIKDTELSGTSKTLTVLNKSSVDVDVTVSATVDALTGGSDDAAYEILLADAATFEADDDSTSIYLGLNVDEDDAVVLTAADGASVTKTLAGAADKYKETYVNEDGKKYDYVLDATADDADFAKLEFSLTGACNTNADWTNAKDAVPSINLVWGFDKDGENTKGPKVTLSKTGLITVSGLTADQNFKSGTFQGVNIKKVFSFPSSGTGTRNIENWSAANGGEFTYQLVASYVKNYSGDTVTVTVTLTDGSTITATTKL